MAFTPEEIAQILEEFFATVGTRQYIGARYVPIFGRKDEQSIEWDNTKPYEPLTIVLYQGNSFTSRQYVPVGVDITNNEFWAITGNYNAQVEQYRLLAQQAKATADSALQAAEDAQNDIDTLLPKDQFSDQLTVKDYVDSVKAKSIVHFDTVNAMRNATLEVGSVCTTLRFHEAYDNGGANYVIGSDGTPNGMDVIELDNGLFANLINEGTLDISKLGCMPNGTSPIDTFLERAFDISDKVYIPSGLYKVGTINLPADTELYGDTGSMEFDSGTIIQPITIVTPIKMSSGCSVHDLTFVEPDLQPVSIYGVNKEYDFVIDCTGCKDIDIYNIYFGAINKGICVNDTASAGNVRIHDIFGCCLTTYFEFKRIVDWLTVYHCNFNIGHGYNIFPDKSLYVAYVLKSNTLFNLGRVDYGLFDDISIFVTGRAIRGEFNNASGNGCRNTTFTNLRIDGCTQCISSPHTDHAHFSNVLFANCVFVAMAQEAVNATDYKFDASEIDIWGAYSFIDIYGTNNYVVVRDCSMATCLFNGIYVGSSAWLEISDCYLNRIGNYAALSTVETYTDCRMFTTEGGSIIAKNNRLHFFNGVRNGLVKRLDGGRITLEGNYITGSLLYKSDDYLAESIEYLDNRMVEYTADYSQGYTNLSVCNIPHVGVNVWQPDNSLHTTGSTIQLPLDFFSKFKSFSIYLHRWGGNFFAGVFQANEAGTAITTASQKFKGAKGYLYSENQGVLSEHKCIVDVSDTGLLTLVSLDVDVSIQVRLES